MREWFARLFDWLRREQLDRELQEELGSHRRLLERDTGEDEARRRLGSELRAREASRDRWSWPWLDQIQQDVRYALRGIRRSPGYAITVILTLALGLGANAVMFGVVDRLLFRPFPYLRDPDGVRRIYLRYHDRDRETTHSWFEYTRYLDFRRWTRSFSQFAGVSDGNAAVGTGEAARERKVARVSAAFFDFFDAPPARGRYFGAVEDTTPMGAPVVVLSYDFWQSEFGGRDVLGQPLQVGNVACTIIGVAPEGFVGVSEGEPAAVFMPITTYAGANRPQDPTNYFTRYNWSWMHAIVRLKPGVSQEAADADLSTAYERSWNAEKAIDASLPPSTLARPSALAAGVRIAAGPDAGLESKTSLWVMGVAGIVLLIACANVTNLMLARVLRRQRETAVRLALGVSRGRLARQALVECLVLALLGCAAGLLLAQWGGVALRRLFVPHGDRLDVVTDWRTLVVASGFALVAAMVTAFGASFLGPRVELTGPLKAGTREGTYQRSRARAALLVLQGALSVILLVGAGLFVRSLSHVRGMRLGFDADPVLMAVRNMRGLRLSDSADAQLGRRLLAEARTIPGVEGATWVTTIPFWSTSSTDLYVAGIDSVRRFGRFTFQTASGDYFGTMGTRILKGRAFNEQDRGGTPRVAVVSQAMASVLWPGKDALGQCMRVHADTLPCTTVVGIAEDAVQRSLGADDRRFHYYLPMEQDDPAGGYALLLRMKNDPVHQVEPVRKALQRVMPGLSYVTVRLLGDIVADQRRSWQMGATMFVAFGGLALLVAAVGLYGVIGYNVAQRMHELGVRIALGAQWSDVVRLVMEQGIRFALAGVAVGLVVALYTARWIEPLLFQQKAKDPLTYGVVALLLIGVTVVACAIPAFRAAKADPNFALRAD